MTTGTYTALVTAQHRQPAFLAVVEVVTGPAGEVQTLLGEMRRAFDLAVAEGVQLDQVGEWVGRSRRLGAPIEGVYFAWGTEGVGWSEGVWRGPYDPLSGLVSLRDDVYRLLLRAKVAANAWDGTRDAAYAIWESVFAGQYTVFIQDWQDMSVTIGLAGAAPDTLTRALLAGGYLPLKPTGVRVRAYAVAPTSAPGPLFAWNCDSVALAGWSDSAWPLTMEV